MLFAASTLFATLAVLAQAAPTKRASSQYIHIPGSLTKCLGVKGAPSNGSPIESVQCGQAGYLTAWDISSGNNPNGIPLTGTNFCMDATTGTTNNTPLKVWTCYPPNLKQQTWYYTNDQHIAVTGSNQCVDLGPSGPQTYQCIGGNTNQIWAVESSGAKPPTSTTVSSTTSKASTTVVSSTTSKASTSAVSTSKASTTAVSTTAKSTSMTSTSSAPTSTPTKKLTGQQIHFSGSSTGCLTTGHYVPGAGSPVYINGCGDIANGDIYISTQLWNITRNVAGPVKLANFPNLCLDAGVNPNINMSPVTVYSCLTNSDGTPVAQQNWYYTNDNHLALVGLTQCLDVVRDSKPQPIKPDGTLQDVSTWQCSGTDPEQIFTL